MRAFALCIALMVVGSTSYAQDFTTITPVTTSPISTYPTGDIVSLALGYDYGAYGQARAYTGVVVSGTLYLYVPNLSDPFYSMTPFSASYVYYTHTVVGGVDTWINGGTNVFDPATMSFGTRSTPSPLVGPSSFTIPADYDLRSPVDDPDPDFAHDGIYDPGTGDPPPPPPTGPVGPAIF